MTDPVDPVGSAHRRARREFIRAHHPDVGGDAQDFISGLADLDPDRRPRPAARTPVTVVAHQAWPVSLTTVLIRRLRRRRQPPRVR